MRIALLLIGVWLADSGISLLLQHTALKRRLTSRLSAAFGRQVEVGSYQFSIWAGPTLEAHAVTVAEDPRFGEEYFLRAEALTARIQWRSLLSGHLELGTLSLSRPSLNLVRNSYGDWNLAEWLPRPSSAAANAPVQTGPQQLPKSLAAFLRLGTIEVEDGRVNFKRGDEKLPFAFSDIRGTLETESPGRWRLDLIATPSRAAAIVQQPGMLHLVGHVGGTSSRLRPAVLQLDWSQASITDVLRMLRGRDYGVRGNLDLSVSARTEGDSWLMEGNAALAQLHRWDLTLRADNPAANIFAKARLDPDGSRLEFTDARIEGPHSSAQILGALDWAQPGPASRTELRVVSTGIGLSDVLAWARAFHSNISDNVALNGFAQLELNLGDWPPRIEAGTFDLPRVELIGSRLRAPVRAGPVAVRYDAKAITLAPVAVTFGTLASSFRVDGVAKPDASDFNVHIQGSAPQARDVISAASQLGWNLARGWDIAGPVRCDLHWQAKRRPWHSEFAGIVEWGTASTGASLHAQFLNLPVEQIRGRTELKPAATHVTLTSAQAFGARWSGTFDHDLAHGWQFALAADELSASNVDRWLNPRWRQSFLDRMLPFLNSRAPVNASPEGVRARGRLAVDEFTIAPLIVKRLRGDLSLDGRHWAFSNAEGQFQGGEVAGSLVAELEAAPAYEVDLDFSDVDLHSFAAEFPSLANVFAGSASAKISFDAHGANRSDLLVSLDCRGTARVSGASIKGISLPESAPAASTEPDATSFPHASAAFTCGEGKVQFHDLLLRGAPSDWDAVGSVDYSRNLDLRLRPVSGGSDAPHIAKTASPADDEYRITGTLRSPQIQRIAPVRTADAKH
ncbi:MAG TPA: AsmA-like C-terminal region-containing protein [Candidatus Acidoferrales bacterium]|nr:AsmA-like C-terminal region-containing protein [Candidatus Acidoferrales bacterium]